MLNDLISQFTLMFMFMWHQQWLDRLNGDLMPTIIILCLVSLMIIELLWISCNQSRIRMIKSYLTNITTLIFNSSILSVLSISSVLVMAEKYHHNGLLTVYDQPVQVLISFILFDLTLYLWHKVNHEFDCLWMFHKVHHCDKTMNSSTAFRIHFIEIILGTIVKALFILTTGIEISVILLCEGISTLFIMFHHVNFPVPGEKWLKCLFIVPTLHRVHHSSIRQEHDSNYGAVFSLWDRLFRTLNEPRSVNIGLNNVKTLGFYELLKFGLLSDLSNAGRPSSQKLNPEAINSMIAEAAYYNAEKRGFVSGFEKSDWFEAEQQMLISM